MLPMKTVRLRGSITTAPQFQLKKKNLLSMADWRLIVNISLVQRVCRF